jgi:peptidyl-prolyl cis-trans isomerase SurA
MVSSKEPAVVFLMKRIHFLLFALFLFLPGNLQGEVVDRIVALVNNEVITFSELQEAGARLFSDLKESTLPSEREEKQKKAQEEILTQLIENKLLEQEIKKRKVEIPEKEVDAAIEDILKENRLNESQLKMALAKDGMAYSVYRKRIRDELGKMRLISREIKSKLVLQEEDLRKIYQENIKDYIDPLEVKVQQIFLPVPEGATAEQSGKIRKEAETLLERVRAGEDFAQVARAHSRGPEASEGGVLGFFKEKELVPELEKAAFALKMGEVSGLIQGRDGVHILRVLDRKGGEPKSFAEVQNKIREAKLREESNQKFREWIKALKDKAYIEIKL